MEQKVEDKVEENPIIDYSSFEYCNVEMINQELLDCSRGPDPTSDGLVELSDATNNKEIGFAFDLDGDRLVVVRNGKKQSPSKKDKSLSRMPSAYCR